VGDKYIRNYTVHITHTDRQPLTGGLDDVEEQAADHHGRQHGYDLPVAILRRADHHREPHADVEGRAHKQYLDRLEVQLRVAEQEDVHDPFRLL